MGTKAASKPKPKPKQKASGIDVHCAFDELKDVTELVPHPRNANTHGDRQIGLLAKIIRHQGWRNPITVSTRSGFIVAGHGRLQAAQLLGVEMVPVDFQEFENEASEVAHLTADNRIAELAEIDHEMLRADLDWLDDQEFDLELAGFDKDGFDEFLSEGEKASAEVVEDEVPEAPEVPVTQAGDVWVLGRHRVICGDSTKREDVERVMDGVKADLCFTSPPYGQQRDYTEESDCSDWDGLMNGVFGNLPMSEKGQVLVNLGLIHRDGEWVPYWDKWIQWMREQGWRRFGWYVWDQGNGLMGEWNGRLAPSHEWIFHFNKDNVRPEKWIDKKPESITEAKGTMRGKDGRTRLLSSPKAGLQPTKIPDSVVRITRQVGSDGHPAQFPVSLPTHFLQSWRGIVFEPFLGSGTTLIAAEQLNRTCYGVEISPAYCDIIVKRWENLTGQKGERIHASED